jgi:multidrug efflux system membrane fusion protein
MKWRKRGRVITAAAAVLAVVVVVGAAGPGGEAGKAGGAAQPSVGDKGAAGDKPAAAEKPGTGKPAAGGRGGPAPVVTAPVKVQPMPVLAAAVGTVEPIESVSVRPQVGGVVTEVAFTEGQDVRAGQVLYRLDARPLQAALDAAQAQLARDQAQAANARAQAERYARLVEKDYVTREQADAAGTQAAVYAAAVAADEAAVRQAKLNLAYATVTSPVAGRAGAALVKKGNVVAAGGGPLVVVNQLDPIRVAFALPGGRLGELRRHHATAPLVVRARPSGAAAGESATGKLVFIDNAVGASTGTVALKAEFANADLQLWPGQFVDVEVELAIEPAAVTVPAAAVVTGQAGAFVFVVDGEGKAQRRPVTVRRTIGGQSVVEGELADGEPVIVDGQIRVVPGAAVQVKGPGAGDKAGAAAAGGQAPQGGGK